MYGFKAVAKYDGWRRGVVRGEVHDRNAAVLGGVAGHAGLFGTAAGVAILARQFLPGSELFDLDELGLFVTPRTSPQGDLRTIGFQVPQGDDAVTAAAFSSRAFGHTGFTGTSLFIDPGDATICVLLTNRSIRAREPPTCWPCAGAFTRPWRGCWPAEGLPARCSGFRALR